MTRDPSPRDSSPVRDRDDEPTGSLSLGADPLETRPTALANAADLASGTRIVAYDELGTAMSLPAPRGSPSRYRPDSPDDYLGAVLGSYRVVELLGKGGMGYVFRAEHVKLGRAVAIKLLRGDYALRRDAVSRFFQEARTVNRVRHRNIVDVTDFVELDGGVTYIVMELLTGTSLGAWARAGVDGRDVERSLAVLVQICDGLHAAHQLGVIHRDLKPDNVIVVATPHGELAKILDFGVAKLVHHDDDLGFQTAAGSVIGTPAYMSPEQAAGMEIDARSDIYSLGAIMYEMFCGQPMFRARSFGEYVRRHLTELPVPPRQTPGGANIDVELEAVILRCLEKQPARRFASTIELRDVLLGLFGGRSHSSLLAIRSTTPRWLRVAGGAAVVALGGTAAFWLAVDTGATREPAAPAATLASEPAAHIAEPIAAPGGPAQIVATPAQPAAALVANDANIPAARPALVAVSFASSPSGAVYAPGQVEALCRTPCVHSIDSGDGGPTDRRQFVVRRARYADATIIVDLASGPRAFSVTLEPAPARQAEAKADARDSRDRRALKRATKRARAQKSSTAADARPPARVPREAVESPSAPEPPGSAISPVGAGDRAPTVNTPGTAAPIAPTDTLDPFRRK